MNLAMLGATSVIYILRLEEHALLGIKLKALHLLSKCFIAYAISPDDEQSFILFTTFWNYSDNSLLLPLIFFPLSSISRFNCFSVQPEGFCFLPPRILQTILRYS